MFGNVQEAELKDNGHVKDDLKFHISDCFFIRDFVMTLLPV